MKLARPAADPLRGRKRSGSEKERAGRRREDEKGKRAGLRDPLIAGVTKVGFNFRNPRDLVKQGNLHLPLEAPLPFRWTLTSSKLPENHDGSPSQWYDAECCFYGCLNCEALRDELYVRVHDPSSR